MERKILLPGQLIITNKDEIVWTLLGSCISIVFYNKRKNLSAVCHAQLPHENTNSSCKESCPNPCGLNELKRFKYVTCSFKYMIHAFKKMGISSYEIDVGIYGGANMLNLKQPVDRIGERNISVAKKLIQDHRLLLKHEEVGGNLSRTIIHNANSGITEVKTNLTKSKM